MDITWENLRALLVRFKDGSILLGVLYFLSFLLSLPFWLSNAHSASAVGNNAALLLAAITAFLLTHIFLNWTYYALVVVPAVASVGLFVVGAFIWVATPLTMAPIQAVFSIFTGGFGGGIADLVAGKAMGGFGVLVSGASETISRFGQLLMIISGWFWWLNDRLKSIDHKALGFYLICLSILGFSTGTASLGGVIVFLYVWLWITYRLEGKEGFPHLGIIFKIVGSMVVLTKASQYFAFESVGLGFYGVCVSGSFLILIWKLRWFMEGAPERVRKVALYLVERGNKTFFIGS